jgi:hypothetical protein
VEDTGLLEQPVLLVQAPVVRGTWELLAASGQPVGFARWQQQGPWWWRWLRPVLAVHEHLDEPLLATVQRKWTLLPRHEVHDAEGELVGTLALPWLLDRWGQPLIEVCPGKRATGVFRTTAGAVVGEWQRRPRSELAAAPTALMPSAPRRAERMTTACGVPNPKVDNATQLSFQEAVQHEPLVKMLMLAAVLQAALPAVNGEA